MEGWSAPCRCEVVHRQHNAQTSGKLPPEARNSGRRLLSWADKNAERAERYREVRDHHLRMSVKSEPRTYEPNSPNSYYLDVARSAAPGSREHHEAMARLDRYSRELEVEIKANSAEGKRALRITEARVEIEDLTLCMTRFVQCRREAPPVVPSLRRFTCSMPDSSASTTRTRRV